MYAVALIGADGAGKTTIGRRLSGGRPPPRPGGPPKQGGSRSPEGCTTAAPGRPRCPLRVKYLYMGINPDSSNRALPTTRLIRRVNRALGRATHQGGPPDPARRKPRPKGLLKRAGAGLKSNLRMANQLAEEWFRQCLAWWYQRRGYIVLFDRHFYFDFYASDIAGHARGRPLLGRLHGFLLKHVYPKPDLVILLDAPADVLFARKGEGTVELLEQRRQEYFEVGARVANFAVVNADQPEDAVTQDVLAVIANFRRAPTGAEA